MSSQKDFTVALVGGGIVGLVCAIALAQKGVQVEVFEAASKYGEIGAGVMIQPNALRVLDALGIIDDVAKVAGSRLPFFEFVMGADPCNLIYRSTVLGAEEDQAIGVHRAVLIDTLARLLPPSSRSHFRKRCTGVSTAPDGRAEVRFADGSKHVADIVIGADGIKSAVRGLVFGSKGDRLVDTGHRCYRAIFPTQRLQDANVKQDALQPRSWMGTRKHLVLYSIGDGSMFNLAAFSMDVDKVMVPAGPQSSSDWADWVSPAPRTELLDAFKDFGSDVQTICGQTDETVNKWKIHGLYPPLETHVASAPSQSVDGEGGEENVVIIGDAAHAMVPYLGSGASIGIEDAYVLAGLLGHPQTTRDSLSGVLRAYNVEHAPRTMYIANASKRAGEVYHGLGPSGASEEGRRRDLDRQWDGIWHHDAQAEVERIVETLMDQNIFAKA